jgi:hypothetical protein
MSAPISRPFSKPQFEVADIFRLIGEEYRKYHNLPLSTKRIMWEIEHCRTSELGGHLRQCDECDHRHNEYNSCCNRHCPKCQALAKARWLEARKTELLPVGYFHNVFTIPHEFNPLVLRNKKVVLNILFRAVKETLLAFGFDPKWHLSGQLGFIAILHTWDQKLNQHPHLHVIIPAGAMSSDKKKWTSTRKSKCRKTGIAKDFLFRVEPLSQTFRGKFLDFLKKAHKKGKLKFSGNIQHLAEKNKFDKFCSPLYDKNWVVFSKKPFKGAEHVFDYLGRYVHRVAISNNRIVNIKDGKVTFTWKDRNENYQTKEETVPADVFISRFLLHELPTGFVRIRYYGFLCNRFRQENLKIIRKILGVEETLEQPSKCALELIKELTGIDLSLCPKCQKGRMKTITTVKKPTVYTIMKKILKNQINDSS